MDSLLRGDAPPLVIGHRGAAAVAPENTMPSFEAAWAAGAGWIEADVQPTSDLVPVMLHDDDLDRTTDGSGPIREETAFNVNTLDAGSWFAPEFAGTRVPELAELLAALAVGQNADRRLLLEIKGEHTSEQVLAEIEVIRASRADPLILLESFEEDALAHLRAIEPRRPFGLLVEQLHADPAAACRELGAVAYNPWVGHVLGRPGVVAQLHAAGIAIMVWTSDDPTEWVRLTELGVDGIITNDPGALVDWQAVQAVGGSC